MSAEVFALFARLDQGIAQPFQQAEAGSVDTGDALLAAAFIAGLVGGTALLLHRVGWIGGTTSSEQSVDESPTIEQDE